MNNTAALRAAAYAIAAEHNYSIAISELQKLISELQTAQWNRR